MHNTESDGNKRSADSDVAARAICFVAGFAVGGIGMMLLGKPWTAGWVGAAGTWFGSVATVLTLLWAVRTFRADQARREADAQRHSDELNRAAERQERAFVEEAALVRPRLHGGSGFGSGDSLQMNSIRVRVNNDTKHTATILDVALDDRLQPKRLWPAEFRVPAGEAKDWDVEVSPVPAKGGELSGHPIDRYSLRMRFRLNGQLWETSSATGAQPTRG